MEEKKEKDYGECVDRETNGGCEETQMDERMTDAEGRGRGIKG